MDMYTTGAEGGVVPCGVHLLAELRVSECTVRVMKEVRRGLMKSALY